MVRAAIDMTFKTISGEHNPRVHFAVMPAVLVKRCVLNGSRPGDIVLDPFLGSGRTAKVCRRLGRRLIGCDLKIGLARAARQAVATSAEPQISSPSRRAVQNKDGYLLRKPSNFNG